MLDRVQEAKEARWHKRASLHSSVTVDLFGGAGADADDPFTAALQLAQQPTTAEHVECEAPIGAETTASARRPGNVAAPSRSGRLRSAAGSPRGTPGLPALVASRGAAGAASARTDSGNVALENGHARNRIGGGGAMSMKRVASTRMPALPSITTKR